MPHVRSTVHAQPGDTFVAPHYDHKGALQAVMLCADPDTWYAGPLVIHGDIPTLLALADSLVAACWTLKTAADNAAAEARAEHQFGPGVKCSFCDRDSTHAVWCHPVCDWSDCEDAATAAGPPTGFRLAEVQS